MHKLALLVGLVLGAITAAAAQDNDAVREIQGLLDVGQLEQALAAADQALLGGDGNPEVRFLKGVTLAELGRSEDAVATFEALTRDHPELPEPHNNLAVLYAARGDFDEARDSLLQAIAIHPSYATAHENLGDIYARMAEMSYRRAVSLDASNTLASSKLERLDGLLAVTTQVRSSATVGTAASAAAAPVATQAAVARTAPVGDDDPDLRAAVDGWVAAWSRQDVDAYLASYDAGFRPARGLSQRRWRDQRRSRLTRPAFIQVEIDRFEIAEADARRARVTFRQRYRSDGYSDTVKKELVLVQSNGQWKIQRERSLGAL